MSRLGIRPSTCWKLVVAVALASVWIVSFKLLWHTAVPVDLKISKLDPGSYFTAAELSRAGDYDRFNRINFLLMQAALIVVLFLYARKGPRMIKESAAGPVGTGILLGMLGLAFAWVAQLPFGLAQLWWDRKYGVSSTDYLDWIFENWWSLGGTFLQVSAMLLVVMTLAKYLRHRWWIVGGPAFVAVTLLLTFLSPYLIPDTERTNRPELQKQADRFSESQGISSVPIEVQKASDFTNAPNAVATGLGPTRRVILWDTLIDGSFTDREVDAVVAHEVGHHSRNHLWKQIGWFALFAIPGALLLEIFARRKGGLRNPGAIPLVLLVLTVLQFLTLPAQNAISRRMEAEADWASLQTTRDPKAAESLFRRFSKEGLSDPTSPTWSYVLMDSHPPLMQRIEMAKAWRTWQRTASNSKQD